MANKAYDRITEQLLSQLEAGTVPWQKPWRAMSQNGLPQNATTGRAYTGYNRVILSFAPYSDPRYCTYKQAAALGGTVRKGERGQTVIYWNVTERQDEDGEIDTHAFMRTYTVFNVEQCEGLTELEELVKTEPMPVNIDRILSPYEDPPSVAYGSESDRAYYMPVRDAIVVPWRNQYESEDAFFSTLLHELTHSTGHSTRLNRFTGDQTFGCADYSFEELVAEIGSMFLCHEYAIDSTRDNSVAYIGSWIKALSGDHSLIARAASAAEKAVAIIMGRS